MSTNNTYIPWFNPREMNDDDLLKLATGREDLLEIYIDSVRNRLNRNTAGHNGKHLLLTGTRGAGKSFFLRYAQLETPKYFFPEDVRFVLLPEELRNVRAPHDLLDEIRRMLSVRDGHQGRAALWRTEQPGRQWDKSLKELLSAFNEKLLVVGVENFAELLERSFEKESEASLLRKLMEHEPRLLFLATGIDGSFDQNYSKRFFRQFEHHLVPAWNSASHREYLSARSRLLGRKPTQRQLARIDAYSRYTGGNARVAAVLAAAILDEQNIVSTGSDLNATLDRMSDYYRSLLDAMPSNTEILFDAMVRGGEPCSQTQLAKRVEAGQNDIARAFRWLIERNYLTAKKEKGQKETLYQVSDRLFAQWYRMRYLDPGQQSRLTVMADLLADTLSAREKWNYAREFADTGEEDDALLMAELGFKERHIDFSKLRDGASIEEILNWGEKLESHEIEDFDDSNYSNFSNFLNFIEKFPSDEDLRKEFEDTLKIARCCNPCPEIITGEALADMIFNSLSLNFFAKLKTLYWLPKLGSSRWKNLKSIFEEEKIKFKELSLKFPEDIEKLKENNILNGPLYPFTLAWDSEFNFKDYNSFEQTVFTVTIKAVFVIQALKAEYPIEKTRKKINRLIIDIYKLSSDSFEVVEILLLKLLKVFPENNLFPQKACLYCYLSYCEAKLGKKENALTWAEKALPLINQEEKSEEKYIFWHPLFRLSWAYGMFNEFEKASKILDISLKIFPTKNDWGIGQRARYQWVTENLTSAWDIIHQNIQASDNIENIVPHLGDAVWDFERTLGKAVAYSKGRELLESLASQPVDLKTCVRLLFIDMIDTGVDLGIVRDLTELIPGLAKTNKEQESELIETGNYITKWIDSLNKQPEQGNIDPDWQTTIKELNHSLYSYARIRLGLTEEPKLSKELEKLYNRLIKFLD